MTDPDTFGLTGNTGLIPTLPPVLLQGALGKPGWWRGLCKSQSRASDKGLPSLLLTQALSLGQLFGRDPSVTPAPTIMSKSLQPGPHLQPGYMILPDKNRPPSFEVPEGLLQLSDLLLLTTPRCCEAVGSLNTVSQIPRQGGSPPPPVPPEQAAPSLHPTSSGFLPQHTMFSLLPTCSPRSAWCSQPGLALSSHRTFALSQPLFSLLSPLVNIDLYIRLNIDMGARSPFPIRAANPMTATQNIA